MTTAGAYSRLSPGDSGVAPHGVPAWLDPPFKAIFDESSDGVLVMNAAGHRVYSNPSLNELVGGNACLPLGTPSPPLYVPAEQRQRYLRVLEGMSALLASEGSGTASTWLELATPVHGRVRAKVTIGVFTGPRGGRYVVWLVKPELHGLHGPSDLAGAVGTAGPDRLDLPGARQGAGMEDGQGPLLAWQPFSAVESLTRRERDVLQLLLDGRRVSSIARSLYLSPHTVRNHLKSIFRKLGAHSQSELLDSLRPVTSLPQAGLRARSGPGGPEAGR